MSNLYIRTVKIPSQSRNAAYPATTGLSSGSGGGVVSFLSPLDPYLKVIVEEGTGVVHIRCLVDFVSELGIKGYSQSSVPDSLWDALPHASATVLGGIKVGNNLSIDVDGVLSSTAAGVSSWNELTDKPAWLSPTTLASFEAAHGHAWSGITGTPTTLAGYGITNAASINGNIAQEFSTSLLHVSTYGIMFPADAFGGGGDTAGIRLGTKGGEAQTLELYVTNDADDTVNVITPSNNGLTVNSNIVWNAGNFDPATKANLNGDSAQDFSVKNLNIYGEVSNIVSSIVIIDDAFVQVNTGNAAVDAGFIADNGTTYGARMFWRVSDSQWVFGNNGSYEIIQPLIAAGTTAQYWRGDKTWQTLNTSAVVEGTNLYFTDARAQAAIAAGGTAYDSARLGGVEASGYPKKSQNEVITGLWTFPSLTQLGSITVPNSYIMHKTDSREWWVGVGMYGGGGLDDYGVFDATAGEIRFAISTIGNVGIGVQPSASEKLYVNGATTIQAPAFPALKVLRTTAATTLINSGMVLMTETSGTPSDGFGGGMVFALKAGGVETTIGTVAAVRDGANNSGAITFNPYLDGTRYERMKIAANGNVGVGVSPSTKLDVNGDTATRGQFRVTNASGTVKWSIGYNSANDDLVFYNASGVKELSLSQTGTLYVVGNIVGYSAH